MSIYGARVAKISLCPCGRISGAGEPWTQRDDCCRSWWGQAIIQNGIIYKQWGSPPCCFLTALPFLKVHPGSSSLFQDHFCLQSLFFLHWRPSKSDNIKEMHSADYCPLQHGIGCKEPVPSASSLEPNFSLGTYWRLQPLARRGKEACMTLYNGGLKAHGEFPTSLPLPNYLVSVQLGQTLSLPQGPQPPSSFHQKLINNSHAFLSVARER